MHRFKSWQLFLVCVLTWGTTWYAITFQLGPTAPEVGVAVRFALAGTVVLALSAWRGDRLRFTAREHGLLALQGCFMYGISYICVYHAERYVVSGLVAVGYSASPLLAALGARVLFGTLISGRFVVGGLLGLTGVALIFSHEFLRAVGDHDTSLGALFTATSLLFSTVGSLTASRNRVNGLPFWPALGCGMWYGAVTAVVLAVLQGQSLAVPASISWWLALLYLALAGSVLTFASFLTLQERIGPGPTATVGVMTPLLALVVSIMFEGLRLDVLTVAGAALAVTGNVLMLRRA